MHAHPGALAVIAVCSGAPSPDRQRSAATHVSTWLVASGHVPRTQKEIIQRIRFGGGTYGLISQTNYWCSSVPLMMTQQRKSLFEPEIANAAEKLLLTLEKCGEPDSQMSSGYSRSIGKTDNTQIFCP